MRIFAYINQKFYLNYGLLLKIPFKLFKTEMYTTILDHSSPTGPTVPIVIAWFILMFT